MGSRPAFLPSRPYFRVCVSVEVLPRLTRRSVWPRAPNRGCDTVRAAARKICGGVSVDRNLPVPGICQTTKKHPPGHVNRHFWESKWPLLKKQRRPSPCPVIFETGKSRLDPKNIRFLDPGDSCSLISQVSSPFLHLPALKLAPGDRRHQSAGLAFDAPYNGGQVLRLSVLLVPNRPPLLGGCRPPDPPPHSGGLPPPNLVVVHSTK